MLTPWEVDLHIEQQALKAQAITPQHATVEGAMDGAGGGEDQAGEARRRVQHLAEPYPPDMPKVAEADVDQLFNQAVNVPTGYPRPGHVSPEAFRRGPVDAGEAAYGVSYDVSARPVPVPAGTLAAAAVRRPPLADDHARPS